MSTTSHPQQPLDSVWPRLEPVLTSVRKPARYVGGEGNIVVKDHTGTDSSWLLVYPDAYEVGQPNQGVQILYEVLNERPTTVAERGYAPWTDMEAVMRERGIPFFSLENHLPMRAFDVVAFSLAAEVGYTNLLCCLDLGGVPLHAADRRDDDPLVVIGGHAAFNPEPLAPSSTWSARATARSSWVRSTPSSRRGVGGAGTGPGCTPSSPRCRGPTSPRGTPRSTTPTRRWGPSRGSQRRPTGCPSGPSATWTRGRT